MPPPSVVALVRRGGTSPFRESLPESEALVQVKLIRIIVKMFKKTVTTFFQKNTSHRFQKTFKMHHNFLNFERVSQMVFSTEDFSFLTPFILKHFLTFDRFQKNNSMKFFKKKKTCFIKKIQNIKAFNVLSF